MDKVACTDEQIVCGVSLKPVGWQKWRSYIYYLYLPVSWRPSLTCLHTEISPLWLQNSMHAYIHLAIHIIAFEILTKRSHGGIKEWHIWHFHKCFYQRQTHCSFWFDLCTHKTLMEPGSWCSFWFSSSLEASPWAIKPTFQWVLFRQRLTNCGETCEFLGFLIAIFWK